MSEETPTNHPAAAGAPLPAGFRLRPYAGESDLADLARIRNAEFEADGIPERVTSDILRAEFGHPGDSFDPERDVTVAVVGDEVVGWTERDWVDTWDGHIREYRQGGYVTPAWRRRGVGTALLLDGERRRRERAASHQTDRQLVLGSWNADSQDGAAALLGSHGYTAVRWFFDMIRRSMDDIPDLPLPDGLEVRPITPDLYRAVWEANIEAFRDHWGGFDTSEESYQRELQLPTFDPSLWVIAFDAELAAGGVINKIDAHENEALGIKRGWLQSVWTRRPWRRRGLARATIARSLVLLRDRGMTTAGLGVDADNPSGALGLYESLGFEVELRYTAWRKPFEV
jgi:mycothiol synthase